MFDSSGSCVKLRQVSILIGMSEVHHKSEEGEYIILDFSLSCEPFKMKHLNCFNKRT